MDAQTTVRKILKQWIPNYHEAHQAYINAGCPCTHQQRLEEYEEPLSEIKRVHAIIDDQCSAVASDVTVACETVDKAEVNFKNAAETLTDDLVDLVDQKEAVHAYMPIRKKFYGRVLQAFKRKKVSSLPKLSGAIGAAYREHLEIKQLEITAEKKGQSSLDLKKKRDEVVRWRNVYTNLKEHHKELELLKQRATREEVLIRMFLTEEEEWGNEYYESLKTETCMHVARDGLETLICSKCRGFRWNDKKLPVIDFDEL